MPKGPNGQKRPADGVGMSVMIAKIATGEEEDTSYTSQNRRRSGVAGAKARMKTLSADERSKIATKAAKARWKSQEATMNQNVNACDQVAALYAAKRENGLIDVKFFVDDAYKATREAVCREVLRLEAAIQSEEFEILVFNDRH